MKHIGNVLLRERPINTSQNKEVYSECLKPDGCVTCGGNCPYVQSKPLDDVVYKVKFTYSNIGYLYLGPRGETD